MNQVKFLYHLFFFCLSINSFVSASAVTPFHQKTIWMNSYISYEACVFLGILNHVKNESTQHCYMADSTWGQFFRNAELEKTLDQDLSRLYPEHWCYFQAPGCQGMVRRILLLWCLKHPEYGYRQGTCLSPSLHWPAVSWSMVCVINFISCFSSTTEVKAYANKTPFSRAIMIYLIKTSPIYFYFFLFKIKLNFTQIQYFGVNNKVINLNKCIIQNLFFFTPLRNEK